MAMKAVSDSKTYSRPLGHVSILQQAPAERCSGACEEPRATRATIDPALTTLGVGPIMEQNELFVTA